jgi:hypothetical protein
MAKRNSRPLPLAIEEIDRDWIAEALQSRVPDVAVHSAEVVDINHGTCTKIRLRLDVNEAGKRAGIPETVILKAGFEPHSRDMWYMHQGEARGYRDVIPELKLLAPACYFADFDADRKQGVVIMEDLVARGVTFCSPLKPQTHEQVSRRLTMLARFHAQTLGSRELAPGGKWDWLPDMAERSRTYFPQYLTPETWQRFVGAPRGAAAAVRFHDRVWMTDAVERIAILARQRPHALVHGDTHLGNLYIDVDGSPGFYDIQPHRAPPMMEITYHVAGALDPADRRRWEGALVQHYLDELARNGAEPPGFDDAMHQYGVFLAKGYLIFLVNESFFQPEAVNTAYTARFSAAMIDHDTIGLLKAIN